MPALLRMMEAEDVDKCRVSTTDTDVPDPLIIHFPHGTRSGVFCSLVTFLLSPQNSHPCAWKLFESPLCLFRNCIRFEIPQYPGSVTLIDSFTYFEVHVSTSSKFSFELCSLIRMAVFTGLEKAASTLGYVNSKPEPAFLCPCGKDSPHPATLTCDHSVWICSKNPDKYDEITPKQLQWLPLCAEEASQSELLCMQ